MLPHGTYQRASLDGRISQFQDVNNDNLKATPDKLRSLPDHGGNRPRNLWDITAMPTELQGQVVSSC